MFGNTQQQLQFQPYQPKQLMPNPQAALGALAPALQQAAQAKASSQAGSQLAKQSHPQTLYQPPKQSNLGTTSGQGQSGLTTTGQFGAPQAGGTTPAPSDAALITEQFDALSKQAKQAQDNQNLALAAMQKAMAQPQPTMPTYTQPTMQPQNPGLAIGAALAALFAPKYAQGPIGALGVDQENRQKAYENATTAAKTKWDAQLSAYDDAYKAHQDAILNQEKLATAAGAQLTRDDTAMDNLLYRQQLAAEKDAALAARTRVDEERKREFFLKREDTQRWRDTLRDEAAARLGISRSRLKILEHASDLKDDQFRFLMNKFHISEDDKMRISTMLISKDFIVEANREASADQRLEKSAGFRAVLQGQHDLDTLLIQAATGQGGDSVNAANAMRRILEYDKTPKGQAMVAGMKLFGLSPDLGSEIFDELGVQEDDTGTRPNSPGTPQPENTSTPAPEVTSTPAPGVTSTPAPGVTSTPAPGVTSTPAPGVTSTPAPGGTSTPAPTSTASVLSQADKMQRELLAIQPGLQAQAQGKPQPTATPTQSPTPNPTATPNPHSTSTPAVPGSVEAQVREALPLAEPRFKAALDKFHGDKNAAWQTVSRMFTADPKNNIPATDIRVVQAVRAKLLGSAASPIPSATATASHAESPTIPPSSDATPSPNKASHPNPRAGESPVSQATPTPTQTLSPGMMPRPAPSLPPWHGAPSSRPLHTPNPRPGPSIHASAHQALPPRRALSPGMMPRPAPSLPPHARAGPPGKSFTQTLQGDADILRRNISSAGGYLESALRSATNALPGGARKLPTHSATTSKKYGAQDSNETVAGDLAIASTVTGVPLRMMAAVAKQESGFQQNITSPTGAHGVMQLEPGTASGLGVNPSRELQNVVGGALYLKAQYKEFGSWPLALAAYNAGPQAVRDSLKRGGSGIPNYTQTQQYVRNIMWMYDHPESI
jgi:soluble lytic murein transglycosylase-like protein